MIRPCTGIDRAPPQAGGNGGKPHLKWLPLRQAAFRTLLACGLAILTGCPTQTPPHVNVLPFDGIKLRVTVVDDPAIAAGIARIASQWQAVTGSSLEITEETNAEMHGEPPSGDVLIVSPTMLGVLAEAGCLADIPKAALDQASYEWPQVFEVLQTEETSWAGQTIALPLGSPVFTLIYRQDLLKKLGRTPPTTWSEYQQLAAALVRETGLPSLEPLAEGWSGKLLLARAACYAKHADHFSTLFSSDTMEPLIAGPPFVRALEELLAAAKLPAAPTLFDPATALRELLLGRAAMAITWASAANGDAALIDRAEGAEFGTAELPGSQQVYDYRRETWDRQRYERPRPVPLVAPTGRLVCVSKQCALLEPAIELMRWLSGPKWSATVASQSPATTLFRDSHLKNAKPWCNSSLTLPEAEAYGEAVQQALERTDFLAALRIPAADQYMAALDRAVATALARELSPQAALEKAAAQWQQITDRAGRDAQRTAYQHSNGLSP